MIETLSPVAENKHQRMTGLVSSSNFLTKASRIISAFRLESAEPRLPILSQTRGSELEASYILIPKIDGFTQQFTL